MSLFAKNIYIVEYNPYAPRPFVFTDTAICLRDSIKSAGFYSEHLVNQINPEGVSIILGGTPKIISELKNVNPNQSIIFNFEQLGSGSSLANNDYVQWLSNWKVVDYNIQNINYLKSKNGNKQWAMELPIIPSSNLITLKNQTPITDVLFYGTPSPRRETVLREVEAHGLIVTRIVGSYGTELSSIVRQTRLVLHIHFYETKLFPVTRMLRPAVMGVPIVCEASIFSTINNWSRSGITLANYEDLANTCLELIKDPNRQEHSIVDVKTFCKNQNFKHHLMKLINNF